MKVSDIREINFYVEKRDQLLELIDSVESKEGVNGIKVAFQLTGFQEFTMCNTVSLGNSRYIPLMSNTKEFLAKQLQLIEEKLTQLGVEL